MRSYRPDLGISRNKECEELCWDIGQAAGVLIPLIGMSLLSVIELSALRGYPIEGLWKVVVGFGALANIAFTAGLMYGGYKVGGPVGVVIANLISDVRNYPRR